MEAIHALGDICGTKVSDNFTCPLCGNWRGCAKCSYKDIIGVENLFPEKVCIYFSNKNVYCLVHFTNDLIVFRGFCIHSWNPT